MVMPCARAAVRASRVHTAGPASSSASNSPQGRRRNRPGGVVLTSAMICDRSAWVIRGLRPGPGRSPSPSRPSALNRHNRRRTVSGWQPSRAAMAGPRIPSQLNATI
jgi:hypothetical protein